MISSSESILFFFFFFSVADLPSAFLSKTDRSFFFVRKWGHGSLQTHTSDSDFWECPLFTEHVFLSRETSYKFCLKKDDKSQCGTGCHMKKWVYKLKVQWSKFFSISFIFMWWHINRSRKFAPNNKFLDTSFGWVALDYGLRDLGLSHEEFLFFVGSVSWGGGSYL